MSCVTRIALHRISMLMCSVSNIAMVGMLYVMLLRFPSRFKRLKYSTHKVVTSSFHA
jgi:hypothetical protein